MESGEKDYITKKDVIDMPSALNNQVNLCDSCTYTYPECPSEKDDVIFGNGIGNDNICACNKYQPTIQSVATDINVGDTISRQAVIDELRKFKPEIIPYEKARIYVEETVKTMYDRIVELPTVQPEEHTEKRMETHACDLISRQALCEYALNQKDKSVTPNDIMRFPSSQPETEERMPETEQNVPKDELISKKSAIDALDTAIEHYDGIAEECRKKADIERNDYMDMRDDAYEARQLAQWLNELKYLREKIEQLIVKPEPQWIPVSERLPEDYTDVLVWFEYFRYGDYNCMYATHGIGNYSKEYNSWTINHETGWKDLHVFAWMPLPVPYQRGGEEDVRKPD